MQFAYVLAVLIEKGLLLMLKKLTQNKSSEIEKKKGELNSHFDELIYD